jgi:hypothetical protein
LVCGERDGLVRGCVAGRMARLVAGRIRGRVAAALVCARLTFGLVGGLAPAPGRSVPGFAELRCLVPLTGIWPRLHNPDSPQGRATHGHLGAATRRPTARLVVDPMSIAGPKTIVRLCFTGNSRCQRLADTTRGRDSEFMPTDATRILRARHFLFIQGCGRRRNCHRSVRAILAGTGPSLGHRPPDAGRTPHGRRHAIGSRRRSYHHRHLGRQPEPGVPGPSKALRRSHIGFPSCPRRRPAVDHWRRYTGSVFR